MSSYSPPSSTLGVYNPTNYSLSTSSVSLQTTDSRYLRLIGGSIVGSLAVGGSFSINGSTLNTTNLAYLNNVTAGTAAASKALILDASKNITSINSISTSTLTVNGVSIDTNGSTSSYLTSITPGTAAASKALVLDASKNITSINSISTSSLTVNGVSIDTNGGSLPSYLSSITPGTAAASKS